MALPILKLGNPAGKVTYKFGLNGTICYTTVPICVMILPFWPNFLAGKVYKTTFLAKCLNKKYYFINFSLALKSWELLKA